jgi:hypothetical protein
MREKKGINKLVFGFGTGILDALHSEAQAVILNRLWDTAYSMNLNYMLAGKSPRNITPLTCVSF